ncbi:MAG TPA: LPS export ABC transporter periplasmic protein LptC [Steroidobacteraceae bacterium]|nr:LPS export ABC transporter periplasmic protein LptC [Steroidobacteraceae bacterium]
MIFRIFTALFFIGIIVGSIVLGSPQREAVSATTVQESDGDLGYSARQARLTETGPDGTPIYTMDADAIRQHPGEGVEADQVRLTFRDTEGNLWHARADRGELGQDTNKVDLAGNVVVSGIVPDGSDDAQILTQALQVDMPGAVVQTHDPVVLLWGGQEIKARGLVARLKERRVQLESSIHGTFSP